MLKVMNQYNRKGERQLRRQDKTSVIKNRLKRWPVGQVGGLNLCGKGDNSFYRSIMEARNMEFPERHWNLPSVG